MFSNNIYKQPIPVGKNCTASVHLPYKAVTTFIIIPIAFTHIANPYKKSMWLWTLLLHRVKKGEYLGRIANQYHTTLDDKELENLSSNNLRIGQKLVIYVNPDSAPNSSQTTTKRNSKGETIYTVKSGDTLWDIARKYSGVSVSQIEQLNNITYRDLKPGLTLKIPKTG